MALALAGTVGVAFLAQLAAAERGLRTSRRREEEMLSADRVLTALTVLTRDDLDRRIGVHPLGEFWISVQRPRQRLYRLALGTTADPRTEFLTTVVYRPDRPAQ